MWPWFFLLGLAGVTLIVIPAVNADIISRQLLARLSKFTSMPEYIFFGKKDDEELTVDEYIENTQVSLLSYVIAVMFVFMNLFLLYPILAFDLWTIPDTGATPIRMAVEAWLQAGLMFLMTGLGTQNVNSRLWESFIIFFWTLIRIGSPLSAEQAPRIFFTVVAELRILYIVYVMWRNSPRGQVGKYRTKIGKTEIDGTFNALGTYSLACTLIMAYLVIGDPLDIIGINGPIQLTQTMPPIQSTREAEALVLGLNDFWILIVIPLVVSDRYRFLNYEGMFAKIKNYTSKQVSTKLGKMPLFL
jgi:hypothetical protein